MQPPLTIVLWGSRYQRDNGGHKTFDKFSTLEPKNAHPLFGSTVQSESTDQFIKTVAIRVHPKGLAAQIWSQMRSTNSHQHSRAGDERCDGCHPPQHDKVMFVSTKSRLGRGVFGGVREVQSPRRVHITPSTVGSWGWKASSVINHPQEKGVPYSITNTQES